MMRKESRRGEGGKRPHRRKKNARVVFTGKRRENKHTFHKQRRNIMETRSPQDIETSTEKLLEDLRAVVQDGEELLRAGAQNLSLTADRGRTDHGAGW